MIAGQHFRIPKAVAEVDRDPASEIDQEEGRAVGEQERQYSRPGRRSKTLSYPKLFFTCLHFVIKKFQCYGLSFKKRLVPRRGNNNCLTPEIHTVFSSVRLSVLRKLVQVASPSAMYTNTILPCRRTRTQAGWARSRWASVNVSCHGQCQLKSLKRPDFHACIRLLRIAFAPT